MKPVYYMENLPETIEKVIFLAGPTHRGIPRKSWRSEALNLLEKLGYDGHVVLPEPRDGEFPKDYHKVVKWEQEMRNMADAILFWVPRNLESLPGFTTNVEFGEDYKKGHVFYGRPSNTPKTRYLDKLFDQAPNKKHVRNNLEILLGDVVTYLNSFKYHTRTNGERYIPLHVYNNKEFLNWHYSHLEQGNTINWAEVQDSFWVGPDKKFLFSFRLMVDILIDKEERNKNNEYVFFRPSISTIVGHNSDCSKYVLIEEFRSPAHNSKSTVLENPGGSSIKDNKSPLELASEEFFEETGLRINDNRFKFCNKRQMLATLTAVEASCFSVELTDDEIKILEEKESKGEYNGIEEDTERCYIRVKSLEEILKSDHVDWSHIGMLLSQKFK